jgi:TP901 family phage tail tape measure protein
MVIGLETRFVRLGIQANKSAEEINALKNEIFSMARDPKLRVDPGEITGAIESIVEKTGDLDFARDNLRNIAIAIQATGAQGKNIGEIMGEFQKMGVIDPREVLEALDTLNRQGKEGAFTLQNLAALGPRVVTAYTAMGRTGVGALRELGAALQVIRMGTGSSEQAATAFEAVLRTLSNEEKIKQLERLGIAIFDPEKLKEGVRVLRPINELMVEIVRKAGGDRVKLSQVFDAEAVRAFNHATAEFRRTGRRGSLEKFMQIHGDGAATLADSARAAGTAAASLRNLYTAWQQFADSELAGPIQSLADALNDLDSEDLDRIFRNLKIGAIALGGAVVVNQLAGVVRALGALSGVLGVNKLLRKSLPWLGRGARVLGAAALSGAGLAGAGLAGAGLAGVGVGSLAYKYGLEGTGFADSVGGLIASSMSPFSANARESLALDRRRQEMQGKITVTVEDKRVRVSDVRQTGGGPELEVDTGLRFGAMP